MAHIRHRPSGSAGINSSSYRYDHESTGSHVTNTHQAERHKDETLSSCAALNHVKVSFDQSNHLIFIDVSSSVDLSKAFSQALEEQTTDSGVNRSPIRRRITRIIVHINPEVTQQ